MSLSILSAGAFSPPSPSASYAPDVSVMSLSTLLCVSSGCPEIGEEPNQPTDITFPKVPFGKKDVSFRLFRPAWFQQWKWPHWDQKTSRVYDFDFVTNNEYRLDDYSKACSSQSFLGNVFAGPPNLNPSAGPVLGTCFNPDTVESCIAIFTRSHKLSLYKVRAKVKTWSSFELANPPSHRTSGAYCHLECLKQNRSADDYHTH